MLDIVLWPPSLVNYRGFNTFSEISISTPYTTSCDNNSAIKIAKNPTKRTKHVIHMFCYLY